MAVADKTTVSQIQSLIIWENDGIICIKFIISLVLLEPQL